jgi:hypothetical protein
MSTDVCPTFDRYMIRASTKYPSSTCNWQLYSREPLAVSSALWSIPPLEAFESAHSAVLYRYMIVETLFDNFNKAILLASCLVLGPNVVP